ncbi:MAG TPA: hypothetical protein VFM05_08390, partial [Candidatus Saccharimonadales bacterium]|nr:hypothetical protein [Candidatus Saccharimonadales bacterium]
LNISCNLTLNINRLPSALSIAESETGVSKSRIRDIRREQSSFIIIQTALSLTGFQILTHPVEVLASNVSHQWARRMVLMETWEIRSPRSTACAC